MVMYLSFLLNSDHLAIFKWKRKQTRQYSCVQSDVWKEQKEVMQSSIYRLPLCTCSRGRNAQLPGTSATRVRQLHGSINHSSSNSQSNDYSNAEDYHDVAYAQMLNQRVQKTKKRVVKRVSWPEHRTMFEKEGGLADSPVHHRSNLPHFLRARTL